MLFFRRGQAYSKLGRGFNGICFMINDHDAKVGLSADEKFTDLMVIAFLFRKEIIDRMDEFNWGWQTPIMVPLLSRGSITLTNAFNMIISKILVLAEKNDLSDQVQEMLDRGSIFQEFDSFLPLQIKNLLK